MIKKWNYQSPTNEQILKQEELTQKFNLNSIVCLLLVQKGIVKEQDIKQYLYPTLKDLHNPFEYPDMQKAVSRLNKAVNNKETILIYGDYDADGITAVSLVYKFLETFCTASYIDYYIPDRSEETGISIQGINYAQSINATLMIVLDCGTKAVAAVEHAKTLNIDIIICDHHTPGEILPSAIAVLNARRIDSTYPYKYLSGCGAGFKLMQAFAYSNGINYSELWKFLDLCAISIAADIVPLTGENRLLIIYGLKSLNTNPCQGIKGLISVCGLQGKDITVDNILRKIGPRINASGRISNGKKSVDLLIEDDWEKVKKKSEYINIQNNNRRSLDKKITDEVYSFIKENPHLIEGNIIIVFKPEWHIGVIGILASRLSDKYYKPVIVVTESNGLLVGSARSSVGFDILSAIESAKDLLEDFGGHMFAAGISICKENWELFKTRIKQYVDKNITENHTIQTININRILKFSTITPKLYSDINQIGPFGFGNPRPIFCSLSVKDTGDSQLVGKEKEHIRLKLIDSSGKIMKGFAYAMHHYYNSIKKGIPFDICYTIEKNNYYHNNIQLIIKDIRI